MSVQRTEVEKALSSKIPTEIINNLLDDYDHIKHQFFLRKFQPTELNAARFSESVLRLIEFVDIGNYTPFGKTLDTEKIINRVGNNISLGEGLRFFIPKITRVLLDIRNKRDVAHVGGEVSPNYSDSLFVTHSADWILIELIRNYHTSDINAAKKIIDNITEIKIPVIADVNGFIKVQNTSLSVTDKTLLILYYKQPSSVKDKDLIKWINYKNGSRFKTQILKEMNQDVLIHYENDDCFLLPKGIRHVEKNIAFELIV